MKGIENGRAAYAYNCVEQAKTKRDVKNKEYKAYCKRIPMMIKTNGLAGTIAFVKTKKDNKAYGLLYRQLSEWLAGEDRNWLLPDFGPNQELIGHLVRLDSTSYRAVTVEVLALFQWLRHLADGLLGEENN